MSFEKRQPAGYFARLTLMSPRYTTSICTPPFSADSSGCANEALASLLIVDIVLPPGRLSNATLLHFDQTCATASISTSAPEGSRATSTVARAGGRAPTWRA